MVKLFNPNEGLHGRQGGPFLDDVQRKQAEETRAIREGREPNYENMQPYVGDQLRTEEQLLQEAIHSATPPELIGFQGITATPVVDVDIPEDNGGDDEPESESVDTSGSDPDFSVPPTPDQPKF